MIDVQYTLLASDAEEGLKIVGFLVFLVIAVIGGLIQKGNKAKQDERERQAARERRRRRQAQRPAQPETLRARPAAQPQVQLTPLEPAGPPPPSIRKKGRVKLKPKKRSVADRHVGSDHVGRLAHADENVQAADAAPRVDLSAVEAARAAMIYHEVFSPPKALRQDKAMWEM